MATQTQQAVDEIEERIAVLNRELEGEYRKLGVARHENTCLAERPNYGRFGACQLSKGHEGMHSNSGGDTWP